jgi:hypothetical protein
MNKIKLIGIKLLVLSAVTVYFAACESSTSNTNPKPADTDVFPNKVGDKWTYSVYDSLSGTTDTLNVQIVGTTLNTNNKSLKIWIFNSRFFNDSLFVSVTDSAVIFYEDRNATLLNQVFEFPLEINKYWMNPNLQFDSTMVTAKESVTVPSGTYPDAYRLERTWLSLNVHGHSKTWFVNNIGIVKLYERIQGFDNINQTRELLSYIVL